MSEGLPTLSGARVVLRRLEAGDVGALFSVFSDAEVTRYWSTPPMTDRAEAAALLEEIEKHRREGDLLQWGITLPDSDTVIGTATLAQIDRRHARAEIGFALGREHWGRGLAREAVSVLLDHAFGEMGLHRIEADSDPGNQPSIRLLERLGFRREGYLPERWYVDGRWHDTVMFGLLKRDWRPDRRVEDGGEKEP